VRQRERESLTDSDPHGLLFGNDDEDGHESAGNGHDGSHYESRYEGHHETRSARRHAQQDRARQQRARRNGRLLLVLGLLVVVAVAVLGVTYGPRVFGAFQVKDYAGSGAGQVTITVNPNDTASDIAATLVAAGVVESEKAFTRAADADAASKNIQPGVYTVRKHMSGKSALALLLDPGSRSSAGDLAVIEGATVLDVEKKLTDVLGADKQEAIKKAVADVAELGIPLGYATPTGGQPTSVEGFLYPATYSLNPSVAPEAALQRMTAKFAEEDRATGFAAKAEAIGLTPYQALIIASIAQSEARYPDDMAKVARVILNRIKADRPLQIDATSLYGARVQGLDPKTVNYATLDSPYNTYLHDGLPPTPVSNPGADAMTAAVTPPDGDWMYYVNSDAEGHLFFTDDEAAFTEAVERCRENNWGCG
jgi:UPF0755 protein